MKWVAVLFWIIAAPIICYGMVWVVGETVEHFTPDDPTHVRTPGETAS